MSNANEIDEIRERKLQQLMDTDSDNNHDTSSTSSSTPSEPIHIDGADHLDEVTGRHRVVLVDFYADWCGPCQMLEPTVKEIAQSTKAAVAKVDINHHQALAGQLGIRGVPTIFLYVDGEPIKRLVGVQDQGTLTNLVEQYT
jgi:thioredoxin 1